MYPGVLHRDTMAQITLRVPEELLEEIEDDRDAETTRSEWLRDAARRRLSEESDVSERVEELESRLEQVEAKQERSVLDRILR